MTDSPKPTESGYPRTLILTPTRELAEQLAETIKRYAQFLPLTVTAFYGGVNMEGAGEKAQSRC